MSVVASTAVKSHIERFFVGHRISYETWDAGPIVHMLPHFQVACIAPGPKTSLWTYVSIGASDIDSTAAPRFEFLLCAPSPRRRLVGFLAMAAFYHREEHLGLGHTFPIGEPWGEGSHLSHVLVSLPYSFAPELQICDVGSYQVHLLWLLPITGSELRYKVEQGVEALESKFDEARIEHWNPLRTSVIQDAV